jgi:hypothetical protein
MKNKKKIDQATATKPYSKGGILPLDHGVDEEDVGEGGDLSGSDSDGFSPSNVRYCSLCFHVYVFLWRSSSEPWGSYI